MSLLVCYTNLHVDIDIDIVQMVFCINSNFHVFGLTRKTVTSVAKPFFFSYLGRVSCLLFCEPHHVFECSGISRAPCFLTECCKTRQVLGSFSSVVLY